MVDITQEDLPYIVLTEDPNLQAYRTDRISGIHPVCPEDGGDFICEQVSYEPLLSIGPADGASSDDDGGGSGGVVIAIIAAVIVIGGGILLLRRRRKDEGEPLEYEE